jgi:adenylate kinase family enzyme
MIQRIHILGASGSGTTTLGRDLANHLHTPHFDTDDYFWLPTDPPFTKTRHTTLRQQRLLTDLQAHGTWVLSGSLCGWGDGAIPLFELVIFLWIPATTRMQRLRRRERERYGMRIMPGGDMHEQSQAFLHWAASYDDGDVNRRSRRLHETWLSRLSCPMVRLEGEYTIKEQIDAVATAMSRHIGEKILEY